MGKVLVIDDEPNAVRVLSAILATEGYDVRKAFDVEKAVEIIDSTDLDAIITDMKMSGKDGIQLFEYVMEHHPDIPVIFLTAFGTVESAVAAMNLGAFYYFMKPPDYEKLKGILSRAVEQRRLKREVDSLKKRLLDRNGQYDIIGNTPGMCRVFERIEAVKDSSSSILITGETGTGKELVARAIHKGSLKSNMPFVTVNCAAIPKELMESELFGSEKGAFTGALARRSGKFEEASNGVIFLDEIGELELSLQAKLLRVLQEREIERLGSNKKVKVNFRLISSTNRDLSKEVAEGRFREDLFYRINVIEIHIPPLRERTEDIPVLASEFVQEFCIRENKALTLSGEVMRALMGYTWPGNVRQMRNVLERAVILAKGEKITIKDLPAEFLPPRRQNSLSPSPASTLKELEIEAVKNALTKCSSNKSKAAQMLGISRKSLYKRLREAPL